MSETYVPAHVRRLVFDRAGRRCEYCRHDDTLVEIEIDHAIAEKHDGPTVAANLAVACARCNRAKGSDVASVEWFFRGGEIDWAGTLVVRLFNPRQDTWAAHFAARTAGAEVWLDPLTPVGRVTIRLLGLNEPVRRIERGVLHVAGRYPLSAGDPR